MTTSPISTERILQLAKELGADAVGIASLGPVDPEHQRLYQRWVESGKNAGMTYLERNNALRLHPGEDILPGAKSVVIVALSYYPDQLQPPVAPLVSKYAYGMDYHTVLRRFLGELGEQIHRHAPGHSFRAIVDTVPFLERYWAEVAGVGFIGRNHNLIVPGVGSFVFLGELLTTLELEPTRPRQRYSCGTCKRCLEHCPTNALTDHGLDARLCVSYLTIEHKGAIPEELAGKFGPRFYGCDTCQDVCPYNHRPRAQRHFPPSSAVLNLTREDLIGLTPDTYRIITRDSAISRAKYPSLLRNASIYLKNNP